MGKFQALYEQTQDTHGEAKSILAKHGMDHENEDEHGGHGTDGSVHKDDRAAYHSSMVKAGFKHTESKDAHTYTKGKTKVEMNHSHNGGDEEDAGHHDLHISTGK